MGDTRRINLEIGIRTQSIGLIVLTAIWYLLMWLEWQPDEGTFVLGPFWATAALLLPFVLPLFVLILLISNSDAEQRLGRLVYPAALFGISPLLWIVLAFVIAYYR